MEHTYTVRGVDQSNENHHCVAIEIDDDGCPDIIVDGVQVAGFSSSGAFFVFRHDLEKLGFEVYVD